MRVRIWVRRQAQGANGSRQPKALKATHQEKNVILLLLPPSSFSKSKSYTAQRQSCSGRSPRKSSYEDESAPFFSTTISVLSLESVKMMYLVFFPSFSSWYASRHSGFTPTPEDCAGAAEAGQHGRYNWSGGGG